MSTTESATVSAIGKVRTRCAWTPKERAEWVSLLEASGQGLSEFCRENGLPESTVSLWRKQLREPASAVDSTEEFLEVALASAPAMSGGAITLTVANDLSLSVPVGTDAAWLCDLVRQLRTKA